MRYKMSFIWPKKALILYIYYYIHSLISCYITCDWQITLTCVINKRFFIFIWKFCLICVQIHVSKIYKFSTIRKKFEPIISNNMWTHVLRFKVGWYFPCFLVTYLPSIVLLFYMSIVHLLQIWVFFGIHCKLITDLIE